MASAQLAIFKIPAVDNEPMVNSSRTMLFVDSLSSKRSYGPGSTERRGLEEALAQMEKDLPFEVPCIVNGKPVSVFFVVLSLFH
jgi:1-pyrroline-5-carboxylate dehydrogenase